MGIPITESRFESVVGPPSSSEDSRALARPETLSEVYAYIEDRLEVISDHYISTMSQTGYDKIRNEILQHLTQLDQGPVAKEPPFDWRRTPGVNATESRQPEA